MRKALMLFLCVVFFADMAITQNDNSFFEKGKEKYAVGDYKSALDNFEKSALVDPWMKDLNYYAGMSEYNLNDYNKAIYYFNKELKKNKNLLAYLFRAKSKGQVGLYHPALKDFRRAKRIDRQNVLVYIERGNLKFDREKYKKAIKDYKKALEIRPGLETAFYKIGFCKYYLKDSLAACENWNKIEDLDDFKDFEIIERVCKLTVKQTN